MSQSIYALDKRCADKMKLIRIVEPSLDYNDEKKNKRVKAFMLMIVKWHVASRKIH